MFGRNLRLELLSLAQDAQFDAPGRDAIAQRTAVVASAIGRALHTVQDNCSHQGMPNPQHAWFSLDDACRGTTESPDLVPAAFACAETETDAIFAAVAQTVEAAHVSRDALDLTPVTQTFLPSFKDICDFLDSAKRWDGGDHRWNGPAVGADLRAQLIRAITTNDDTPTRACPGGPADIADNSPVSPLDVTGGAQSCTKIHIFCLGKADAPATSLPYEPTPTAPAAHGCAFSGRAAPPLFAAWLVLLLLLRRTRRV
jgi:hypothetical protein